MRFVQIPAALVAVVCLTVTAVAQDQSSTRAFVDQISLRTDDDNALARWDQRVCVGAVGLAPAEAQALVDRISARAQAVGLRTGEPGCRANVMVIYAPDSDAISRQIVDQRRDLLGFQGDDGRITAGREAMEDFANTPRPIRWWHISTSGVGSIRPDAARARRPSGTTAAMAASGGGSGGASGVGAGDVGSPLDIQGAEGVRTSGTRTRAEVRNDLSYALVVVDARRVANVPAGAWMDYVALVTLAQLDPDSQTANYPTILNLFNASATPPTGLTNWDVAYLQGLYNARSDASGRQLASIARRMDGSVGQN
ncbi:MAG: hypothetical protein AB7H66_08990 [Hyphomonadaceae bacterium]